MFATHLLPRTRLIARLTQGLRAGHVLIEAPGGYGKTTLLRALVAQRPSSYFFGLTPDEMDLGILQSQLEAHLRQPGATLVLDNVQLLDEEPDMLAWLADQLAQPLDQRARFVLAGRHVALPNAPLLAASQRLVRLSAADLAFSQAEGRQLGVPDDWSRQVEGWPLGLALVQNLAAQSAAPLAPLPASEPLFETLARLLFADLPPELRRFVLVTSVPLRFNLALAAALLQATETQTADWLREAQRRALFLQPTEPAGWLRYHDLIRQFLLQQHDPQADWLRAAAWFEAAGDLPLAIEHALPAPGQAEAVRLLEQLPESFVYHTGRYRSFRRWVLALSPAQQAQHPLLLVRLAANLMERGLRDEAWQYLEQAQSSAQHLDLDTQARVTLGLVDAYISEGNAAAAQPLLEALLAEPALPEPHRRGAYRALGGVYYYQSRLSAARQAYQRALALAPEALDDDTLKIRHNLVGVALIPLGDFEAAEQQLTITAAAMQPKLVAYIWHLLTWCWLYEEMGNWPALRRVLDELQASHHQTEVEGEDDSGELTVRALYHIGVGEFEAADAVLQRLEPLATNNPDIALYAALCQAWLARRRGQPLAAVALAEQALAQPWDVPLTRSLLALELELARFALGEVTHALHPELRGLVSLRARQALLRLRALLALRCHAAGQLRWRRHAASVLRASRRYGFERLLVTRDPELGAPFWALCAVEGLGVETAVSALRQIGKIEPLLPWLQAERPAVRARAARALAAVGDERALPALVQALSASQAADDPLEPALLALERVPPPLLSVRLMGQFSVQRGADPVPAEAFGRPAARRLLQYFALHTGQPLPRDQILDDLWPDSDPAAARKLLNTTLSSMRKAIEPYLRPKSPARYFTLDNETYTFAAPDGLAAGRVRVDTVEFARVVSQALRAAEQQDVPELSEALRAALNAWQPLLPETAYEAWTLAPREALRDLYLRGCLFAANTELEWRRFTEAERWARQAIAVSAYSEEAYQALMRAQARQGNRGQALHTYAEAVAALLREFDAPPSSLTEWLAARLRRDEEI